MTASEPIPTSSIMPLDEERTCRKGCRQRDDEHHAERLVKRAP